jgi:hypothetical protein
MSFSSHRDAIAKAADLEEKMKEMERSSLSLMSRQSPRLLTHSAGKMEKRSEIDVDDQTDELSGMKHSHTEK